MKHFIFGYGSLLCPQSRSITAPGLTSIAEPCLIKNIERTWSARVTRSPSSKNDRGRKHIEGWTPMGVRVREGTMCNGVLICIDEDELRRFDVRETGYDRHRIDVCNIMPHVETDALINEEMPLWTRNDECTDPGFQSLAMARVQCPDCRIVFEKGFAKRRQRKQNATLDDDSCISVWVYIQSCDLPANPRYPITQSYLDIIMRGCLSISYDFARRFLETTDGWWHDGKASHQAGGERTRDSIVDHHTWINDRHNPMYVRADSDYSIKHGEVIDKLIEEHHPDALKRRVMSI